MSYFLPCYNSRIKQEYFQAKIVSKIRIFIWAGKAKSAKKTEIGCEWIRIQGVATWARLFKAGLRYPRVSAKFEFRVESLNSKFSLILFVYNLMIGYSKKIRENCPRKCF